MGLMQKYISQRKYMEKNPDKVDTEKKEKHEWLRDEIIMHRMNEDDITNNITPFYSLDRQEVIN